jgi:hypothetical protein
MPLRLYSLSVVAAVLAVLLRFTHANPAILLVSAAVAGLVVSNILAGVRAVQARSRRPH